MILMSHRHLLNEAGFFSKTKQVATFDQVEDVNHYGTFSVCGDTHGQFFDLVNIFEEDIGGFPSKSNVYLFNGDFVDRGRYSVEVILTLLSIKLSDPSAMHLLRGNYETKEMNEHYGFKKELERNILMTGNCFMRSA